MNDVPKGRMIVVVNSVVSIGALATECPVRPALGVIWIARWIVCFHDDIGARDTTWNWHFGSGYEYITPVAPVSLAPNTHLLLGAYVPGGLSSIKYPLKITNGEYPAAEFSASAAGKTILTYTLVEEYRGAIP